MEKLRLIFLYIFLGVSSQVCGQELYVGTYNIRYDNEEDRKDGNDWESRCPVICGQLNFEHPDVFGAQEVLHHQLQDMLKMLVGYSYIGVGAKTASRKANTPLSSTTPMCWRGRTAVGSGFRRHPPNQAKDGTPHANASAPGGCSGIKRAEGSSISSTYIWTTAVRKRGESQRCWCWTR